MLGGLREKSVDGFAADNLSALAFPAALFGDGAGHRQGSRVIGGVHGEAPGIEDIERTLGPHVHQEHVAGHGSLLSCLLVIPAGVRSFTSRMASSQALPQASSAYSVVSFSGPPRARRMMLMTAVGSLSFQVMTAPSFHQR